MFTIATWNINSVRLRAGLVARLLGDEAPDILCLQECKSPVDKMPLQLFHDLGWRWSVARGQRGYNGVAILSRVPITDAGDRDHAGLGHARHVAARTESGVTIHNVYVPAGGDVPDRDVNEKFGQKLDYLTDMRDTFHVERPARAILVGDLNIAPREDDVWSHKQLLKIVSHTPTEVAHLSDAQAAGGWVDITRQDIPSEAAVQLVELSQPRLGGVRPRPAAGPRLGHGRHRRVGPQQPHPAPGARLGPAQRPCAGVCQL